MTCLNVYFVDVCSDKCYLSVWCGKVVPFAVRVTRSEIFVFLHQLT